MPSVKRSISLTQELAQALARLAQRRGEDLSRLIEILLRENDYVKEEVSFLRDERARRDSAADPKAAPSTKKGRKIEKLRILGRLAERKWAERLRQGQVRFLDR